jgi:hypothetical protein
VGFPLQSLARRQLRISPPELPVAISRVHNCCSAIMHPEPGGRNLRGLSPSAKHSGVHVFITNRLPPPSGGVSGFLLRKKPDGFIDPGVAWNQARN